jgi:hypothetical protein
MADQRQTELPSGNDPARLPEVRGWNWGAFFFTWLWAFAHRLPVLGVVSLIIFLTPVLSIFTLVFAVHLGRRGNELAWRRRPFASLEDLRATQRAWATWGFRVVITVALLASLAWPPLHWPPARHSDCARCHLKRTERFLREGRRRAAAPPRPDFGLRSSAAMRPRSRRPQTPQSDDGHSGRNALH